jgi:hypothetical protein
VWLHEIQQRADTARRGTVTDSILNSVLPMEQWCNRSSEDMLVAYSTLPGKSEVLLSLKFFHPISVLGYVSYRYTEKSSWFFKALCDVFAKKACIYPVERLLQRVDEKRDLYDSIQEW